jgi:hypothetical protein
MTPDFPTPWHKASYDKFLLQTLPKILTSRIPDSTCSILPEEDDYWRILLEVKDNSHSLSIEFPHTPAIKESGVFYLDGEPYIVVPVASQEELDQAEIRCVGEQLEDELSSRLGYPPAGLEWDANLLYAFFPIDRIISDFFKAKAQRLDTTNWHSRQTHLHRIIIPGRKRVAAPGQMGRVDPFETPEGPLIGRVFTIALGAEIRNGKILILDSNPEATLGPNAALIPFIGHNDANRLLMGDNMMRQGLVPPEPEPALVQTGREPSSPGADLWCGRNLLTAFIAWGEGCVEDGLVISQSCAARLNYPYPAEPGDKLSNRHGTKGVVSQVVPDDQMPHLANGQPVEICYSFTNLASRCQVSLVLESVMGKIAHAEGQPVVIPSFHSPSPEQIQARLQTAGFSPDGMERLHRGKDGPEMPYPSTVGWVYWYRLVHLARPKLATLRDTAPSPMPAEEALRIGELEYRALIQAGAYENALEAITVRSFSANPAASHSPYIGRLIERLAPAGITCRRKDEHLSFEFQTPQGDALHLAQPFAHPWMPTQTIQAIGRPSPALVDSVDLQQRFTALVEANEALSRRLESHLPERLVSDAVHRVAAAITSYFDALISPSLLRLSELQRFSASAVISPAVDFALDQVGLPDEIYDALFAPSDSLVKPTLPQADQAWVLILRQPAISPTSFLAFHPVRVPGAAIRLHPQACELLNTDFDGDQVSVFLPLSAAAQVEAGRVLSIAGHITRIPALVTSLISPHEGIWGAAYRSLDPLGKSELANILDCSERKLSSPVTQDELNQALQDLLTRQGVHQAIATSEQLMRYGYVAASQSGASMHPFLTSQVPLPPPPEGDDPNPWAAYLELCSMLVLSGHEYHNPNMGPQLLSAVVPVRQKHRIWLAIVVTPRGPATDASGQVTIIRHSFAQGYSAEELFATVAGARTALARMTDEWERSTSTAPTGDAGGVLSRARRARFPGVVFAAAAAAGAVDPLSDHESRILAGLLPRR